MKCPKCENQMRRVKVKIQDAESPVISYQCPKCDHFEFEEKSAKKVLKELKEKTWFGSLKGIGKFTKEDELDTHE